MGENKTRRGISILSWNIAGIIKAKKAEDYIKAFDIVLLQETWVEKGKERAWLRGLNRNFIWKAKAAERERERA